MNGLVGGASHSLREQNDANQQLIVSSGDPPHADAVEEAGIRQRAAVELHVAAAKSLIDANNAARQARTVFDGMPFALPSPRARARAG